MSNCEHTPATNTPPPFDSAQVDYLMDLVDEAYSSANPAVVMLDGINEIVTARLAVAQANIALLESEL